MPFPRRLLTSDEELVLDLRPHWIALVGPVFVTLLLVAAVIVGVAKINTKGVQWVIEGIAVVLFIAFGSLLAMLLPIVTAIAGVGGGLMAIAPLTHTMNVVDFAPIPDSHIGELSARFDIVLDVTP